MTPDEIRAKGYTILTDPSQIQNYTIAGQYGKTGAKGSFLYGKPKAGRSLEGTLPQETPERSLGDTTSTTDRTLTTPVAPGTDNSFANLRSLLAQTTRLAASQGPSAQDYLDLYTQGGVPLTSPTAISSALERGTLSRAGMVQDVYKGALDLISELEKNQQERFSLLVSKLPDSIIPTLSGQEWEELKSFKISPELKQRIAEAQALEGGNETAPKVEKVINPQTGEEQSVYWDSSTQSYKPVSVDSPQSNFSTDINSWISNLGGSITTDYDTPVSYFTDGRKTHSAIDIAAPINSPVTSPVSGKVIEAGASSGWGNTVVIQDAQGNNWRLAHFNKVGIKVGDQISAGQQLGLLGNTGYVLKGDGGKPNQAELAAGRGAHIHLEVKDAQGKLVDPRTISSQTTSVINQGDFDDPEYVKSLPVSMLTKSIISGYGTTKDLTPTDKSKVITELYKVGYDPKKYVLDKLDNLLGIKSEMPDSMKGLLQGYLPASLNEKASEFESAKIVLTRQVARLYDVGMLSDQDVADYKKAMPARTDLNEQTSEAKVNGLKKAIGAVSNLNKTTETGTEEKPKQMKLPNGTVVNLQPDGTYK
jgi:murein DD-endopeptidase MepM/ murein hydrolase activator NlpD